MKHETTTQQEAIQYPFMPKNGTIVYVGPENEYMQAAKKYAKSNSLDKVMPNASVVVKNGKIIGRGANGSTYHEMHECERVKQHIPTGQGYELCEGCHPKNHSEPQAIADALQSEPTLQDASLYLWGHWWCCEPCWEAMIQNGITTVHLLANSEVLFNKAAAGNIVGQQFHLA